MEGEEENVHAVFMLACLAQKTDKHAFAVTAWGKYLAVRPFDPKGHYNLGVCLHALGEERSALGSFETAFDLQPTMADAGANAAGLLIQRGEAERACALCYLALKGNPDFAPALFNLNTALRMVGRQDEAVAFSWQWIQKNIPTEMAAYTAASNAAATATTAAAAAAAAGTGTTTAPTSSHSTAISRIADGHAAARKTSASSFHGLIGVSGPGKIGGDGDSPLRSRVAECSEGGEGRERGGGGAGSLTVACVRWGQKYGPEYVERLAAGVRRNLRRRHTFVCFTDDVGALGGMVGVAARPLGARCGGWRGWWHKSFIFSRESGLSGRVLYIDLDTVIAGPLDEVAGYCGPFAALSVAGMANERRSVGINSSVMSWDAGGDAAVGAVYELLEEAYGVVTACVHKLDHWLEMVVPGAKTLQKAFPGQVVEYRADCCGVTAASADSILCPARPPTSLLPGARGFAHAHGGTNIGVDEEKTIDYRGTCGHANGGGGGDAGGLLPRNARIICFPLEPKPHQVTEGWVQRLWVGDKGWSQEGTSEGAGR